MKALRFASLALAAMVILSGCNFAINKSITIDDGETVRGSQNAVNGNIYIGSGCKVNGDCRSVNGVIEVGDNSRVKDLQAVNGRIKVDREVMVRGSIESVNGSVSCKRGVEINGDLTTINGDIDIENTVVERDIKTYNGDITLMDKSIIRGDIIIKKGKGSSRRHRRLNIEIMDDSIVKGNIIVKDRRLEVKVYLSNGGRVEGRVQKAEVIKR